METQNIKIVGNPMDRKLHLVGEVTDRLVTFLIDSIMAINDEEEAMTKMYEYQQAQLVSKIEINKVVETDTGLFTIKLKTPEVTPIELYVNSVGGSLSDGMALIQTIQASDVPVIAIVSNASSMATVVALACDRVETYATSHFMIHQLSYGMGGTLREQQHQVKNAEREQRMIDKIILDNSEIPPEDLKAHYDNGLDWYIDGDDIRDFGMTNEIIPVKKSRDTEFTINTEVRGNVI